MPVYKRPKIYEVSLHCKPTQSLDQVSLEEVKWLSILRHNPYTLQFHWKIRFKRTKYIIILTIRCRSWPESNRKLWIFFQTTCHNLCRTHHPSYSFLRQIKEDPLTHGNIYINSLLSDQICSCSTYMWSKLNSHWFSSEQGNGSRTGVTQLQPALQIFMSTVYKSVWFCMRRDGSDSPVTLTPSERWHQTTLSLLLHPPVLHW